MKKHLLRIAVVLCALAVLAVGTWWVWRAYYSAEQFRAAVKEGIASGDFSRAERLKAWGADTGPWREEDSGEQLLRQAKAAEAKAAEGKTPEEVAAEKKTAEEKAAEDKDKGAPEAYADFTMPEGVTVDEAAMKEADPGLRERLWEEYRKYKTGEMGTGDRTTESAKAAESDAEDDEGDSSSEDESEKDSEAEEEAGE